VHELARSRLTNTNELFDAATNYAAGEEAVGAIFDDKSSKRKDDAPAEGGNVKPNAARGRRRTPRRPSLPPRTAKDLEAPLEAAVASSTTCLRSRALTTRAR